MSNDPPGPHSCRRSIEALIAGKPSRNLLFLRIDHLEYQAAQCDKFFPWPRLAASFRKDAKRLREILRKM